VAAGVGNVSVASGSYTDSFGNQGGGASLAPISIDTLRPTVNIAFADARLGIGESTLVTFTFSEAVTGFTLTDAFAVNATLSGLTTSDNIIYKATLTAAAGVTDTSNVITVDMTGVADVAGNAGAGTTESPNYVVDAQRPTATIVMSDAALKAGETSTVTFTFSEAVTGFTTADVAAPNGTLSTLISVDGGITWTATFTPNLGVDDTTNVMVLDNTGYTDLAGNAGIGLTNSSNYSIDTVVPTATVVVADAELKAGETSTVTVTFSEAVAGFSNADLTVKNGELSSVVSIDGGVTWTATFTPTANLTETNNVIVLDQTGVTNARGNAGVGTVESNNYEIDTALPTATIVVGNPQLQAGQTSLVTITFSESVVGFDLSDLSVANGVLSSLVSADGGKTWTALLTPTAGVTDATNLIVLDTAVVVDAAGNAGSGIAISNNYAVGYVPPPQQGSEDDVISLPSDGGSVAAGPGDDSVSGGAGADVIQGNTGDDTLIGGRGDDIVSGGRDNDFIHGNVGADRLFGDLGNDSVFGGQGDDFVQGGAGDDYVLGDLGRDTVLGGQGADTVLGGAGDDYISGDLGDDVLVGGAGADLFNFNGGGGRDLVMDFSQAEGDRIRISPADAANFAALSAKISTDGGDTLITLGGQTIVLAGVAKSALSAADFVFG
jgi:Ca2+-binding RTX toxin-like protein